MPFHFPSRARLLAGALLVAAFVGALSGCGNLSGALPTQPSPFPTMARLPSVTPMLATRTPLPTLTPILPTPTPIGGLRATVNVDVANMRAGPGTGFKVVGAVKRGTSVILRSRSADWYAIATDEGLEGWMAGAVLAFEAGVDRAVPTTTP